MLNQSPDLIVGELVAAELVIHPGTAADFFFSAVDRQLAFGLHSSQRIVIRCASLSFCFLAETVLAVENGRLERRERKPQSGAAIVGVDSMLLAIAFDLPIFVPNEIAVSSGAGSRSEERRVG